MKKKKIIMKNKYVGAESISAQRNINNTNQSNANDVGVAWYVAQGPHAMQHTKSTNNQRGITLIALTVTIIVILILAIATFLIFSEHGIIEHAKMSKFSTEYREVQELVEIYTSNQEMKQVIQDIQKQGKTENTVKLASKQSTKIAMQEQQTQTNQTKTTLPVISKLTNEEKEELKKLIKLLKEKYKKTVIILTKDTDFAYAVAEKVHILYKGTLVSSGTRDLMNDETLLNTYGLKAPEIVKFISLAQKKNINLSYTNNILDLIKEVYRNAK